MVDMLRAAQRALDDANQCVRTVAQSNSDVWKGEAAEEFRKDLNGKLPGRLTKAATSVAMAADHLARWQTDLTGFQDEAKRLEGDAAAAKQKRDTALQHEQQASGNADLQLANQQFDSAAALSDAQQRYDTAAKALADARTAANNALVEFNGIIRRAEELQQRHETDAKAIAGTLDDADDIAPHKPRKSIWNRITDQFTDLKNLGDLLAFVGAAAGLAALTIASGGTLAPVLLAASSILSAGALGTHLAADNTFMKMVTGQASWKDWVTVAGDALGMIPGASTVTLAARTTVREVASGVQLARQYNVPLKFTDVAAGIGTNIAANTKSAAGEILTTTASPVAAVVSRGTSWATARASSVPSRVTTAATAVAGKTDTLMAGTASVTSGYDVATNLGLVSEWNRGAGDAATAGANAYNAWDTVKAALKANP